MSKNDQHIFFNLLRAKDNKILYIFLAYIISFILTAIFKTTYFEITTFALLAIIDIWAMSREHKDKKIYNDLCDEIFEVESNVNKSTETVEHIKRKRWQFMHDYATELSTFIWDHITELQARDLSVFDMVPSPVWNKMSEKNEIIVKAILDKYNEAKDGKANAK